MKRMKSPQVTFHIRLSHSYISKASRSSDSSYLHCVADPYPPHLDIDLILVSLYLTSQPLQAQITSNILTKQPKCLLLSQISLVT